MSPEEKLIFEGQFCNWPAAGIQPISNPVKDRHLFAVLRRDTI
jgi:hypothetical protein